MLIFFVFVKLLSLMTNTRVGLAHTPKWPDCGSCYACSHQRPDERLRDFYRKYAGSSTIKEIYTNMLSLLNINPTVDR